MSENLQPYEKLAKKLNIKISEDYTYNPDLQISTWNTADGYDLWVMTDDPNNLSWENEVYYYQPSFDEIINRFQELDDDAEVYIDDVDELLYPSEIEQWLEEQEEKEEIYEDDVLGDPLRDVRMTANGVLPLQDRSASDILKNITKP